MKIHLVIPCYNEEKRLPIAELAAYHDARPDLSFCFVNDGSSDQTLSLLRSFAKDRGDRIAVVSLPNNRGKAEAVRAGILHVLEGEPIDYVGFLDADLATPLNEIDRLLTCSAAFPASPIIFGSRVRRPDAHITRSPFRHYMGRVFAAATTRLLGIPAYDTQCGAKLVRASIAIEIFREPFISRWIFDVELFLRAAALSDAETDPCIEVPLNRWTEKGSSRIRMKDAAALVRDFIVIWTRYRLAVRRKRGGLVVRRAP